MTRMKSLSLTAALLAAGAVGHVPADQTGAPPDFVAPLSGSEEVPPNASEASGQTLFRLINLGDTLAYSLTVQDINNVVAAHIHLGPRGQNGPVVAFLFGPASPGGGPVEGHIAQGTIESANLVGPLMGQDLSVLIQAMRTGGAYVNAHTNDGVDPPNTGPSDLPGGEIRGQIRQSRDRTPAPRSGGGE